MDNDYLNVFCLEYGNEESDMNTVHDNLTYAAGIILDILLEMNIPHNLLFSHRRLYIIPRQF